MDDQRVLHRIQDREELEKAAALADVIWHEHYLPILGAEQVAYMVDRFQSADAMRQQMDSGYLYFLIRDGDMDAGYCAVQRQGDGSLFLSKLYVLSECRGRGLAHRAVAEIRQMARDMGCSRIWLTVNRYNAGSIAAYGRMGFAVTSQQVTDIGGGFVMDDDVMEMRM